MINHPAQKEQDHHPAQEDKVINHLVLLTNLKLVNNINLNNMHCFNEYSQIIKFSTPIDILKHFYHKRYQLYQQRLSFLKKI